jgi:hypothetical protein
MTAQELYKLLDSTDADYEVIEIFDGARLISFRVDDSEYEEPLHDQE